MVEPFENFAQDPLGLGEVQKETLGVEAVARQAEVHPPVMAVEAFALALVFA